MYSAACTTPTIAWAWPGRGINPAACTGDPTATSVKGLAMCVATHDGRYDHPAVRSVSTVPLDLATPNMVV